MGKDPDLTRRRVALFDGDSPMGVVNEELRFAYFDSNVTIRCQRIDESGDWCGCDVTLNENGVVEVKTEILSHADMREKV